MRSELDGLPNRRENTQDKRTDRHDQTGHWIDDADADRTNDAFEEVVPNLIEYSLNVLPEESWMKSKVRTILVPPTPGYLDRELARICAVSFEYDSRERRGARRTFAF